MNAKNSNQLLYDDQSYIKKKINALYALMFTVSSRTKLHPIISCILIFLEDVQLIYYAVYNKSIINLYENIRNIITFVAFDNVNYQFFLYCNTGLELLIIALSLIIAIYVLFVPSSKYKENIVIKCLRIFTVLLYTVLFPVCCHLFAKSLIPKDGKLYDYPDVPYFGNNIMLFALKIISFICFLFLQLCILPFIFVNPTPFKKNNSLCQSYSFITFKYNCIIISFSFLTLILKTYLEKISSYICILLFLMMLFLLSDFLNSQPFYNIYLNMTRSSTWIMFISLCLVNLISYLFGHDKPFFGVLLIIIGICSFFVGLFICKIKFKKHIEGIYKRFKQKKIEDRLRYKRENGIESSNDSEEGKSLEEKEDNLISVDSYDSSENSSNKENKKSDKIELSSEGESEEYENNSENESVSDNFQLNDRISEKISSFGEIRDIIDTNVLNEPVIVFNNFNELELACRFIRTNETNEAFQLMKELYEESIKQYKKDPYLYTYYAYYLLYISERTSKDDDNTIKKVKEDSDSIDEGSFEGSGDSYITSDDNEDSSNEEDEDKNKDENEDKNENENDNDNEKDKNNIIYNEDNNNPDNLLSKALAGKLNFLGKYFVRYLFFEIREKKKEEKDYYKKEALELLVNLQRNAVEEHVTILNLLKKFFTNIKYLNSNRSNNENFDIDQYLELIYNLKKKTLKLYQNLISKYPDEKSTYQLYTLFMTEIINQSDVDKSMLSEGDSFMELNASEEKKDNKKKSRYAGSVSSFGVSVAGGSSFGADTESKRKKILKKNMIHTFTDKSRKISKFIISMISIIFILFIVSSFYGIIHISNFNKEIKNIQIIEDINFSVHRLMRFTRLYGFSLLLKSEDEYQNNIQQIESTLDVMEDSYLPILKRYSLKPPSNNPIIMYSVDNNSGKTESKYVHLNGYELMRKIIVWGRGIAQTSIDEWNQRIDSGENILLDYKFRTLENNYQEYFYNVFKETMDDIYNDKISSQNNQIYVIYVLTGFLIILSLIVNFLGITPLYNNNKNLHKKTLTMFKYLSKSSLNDIISKFEDGIESISEMFDIDFDNKKKKTDSWKIAVFIQNINKYKGFIINILLLGSTLLLSLPIISKDESIINNLNYNLSVGDRKVMALNINVYQYETLLRDIKLFTPGTAESFLNKEINKLENIQLMIYSGQLGMTSTTKMRYLDSILIDQKCRLDDDICESLEESIIIDVTKTVVKFGLNELIEEYIDKAKSTLHKSQIRDIKNEENIYGSIATLNNEFLLECFGNANFLFQHKVIDHLIAGLIKFDNILYENLFQSMKTTLYNLILIIICGIILIILSLIISLRAIRKTSETLNELVNMIFVVPTSSVNMIPQFKRFIETGSFEEE
ncbi:hypothetical protein BCR36DRAFT_57982 [Piromyces finnis]|uniref:Uncharacterized protein n=1 Tax=Piromyces finnis TaxID=1754191 RepID=A0A1Y1V9F7_9FUNG|nr:hypothetical protein BCR36DRAFT_57982 [Piromyces finnis]|eukprot:ORX50292.1 hypothetical protein BCR36DRAFT_57982 [Piromyces finnis]